MIWRRGRSVVCVGGIWIPEWEKKLNSFLCISFSYVLFLKLRVPYYLLFVNSILIHSLAYTRSSITNTCLIHISEPTNKPSQEQSHCPSFPIKGPPPISIQHLPYISSLVPFPFLLPSFLPTTSNHLNNISTLTHQFFPYQQWTSPPPPSPTSSSSPSSASPSWSSWLSSSG